MIVQNLLMEVQIMHYYKKQTVFIGHIMRWVVLKNILMAGKFSGRRGRFQPRENYPWWPNWVHDWKLSIDPKYQRQTCGEMNAYVIWQSRWWLWDYHNLFYYLNSNPSLSQCKITVSTTCWKTILTVCDQFCTFYIYCSCCVCWWQFFSYL